MYHSKVDHDLCSQCTNCRFSKCEANMKLILYEHGRYQICNNATQKNLFHWKLTFKYMHIQFRVFWWLRNNDKVLEKSNTWDFILKSECILFVFWDIQLIKMKVLSGCICVWYIGVCSYIVLISQVLTSSSSVWKQVENRVADFKFFSPTDENSLTVIWSPRKQGPCHPCKMRSRYSKYSATVRPLDKYRLNLE